MRTSVAAALCALAVTLAGCGGDDSSSQTSASSTLTGVHTQFAPSGSLKGAGVKMAAIAPGTTGSTGVVLPITGGSVNLDTLAGTVEQGGGLQYTGGAIQADVTFILTGQGAQALHIDGLQSGMTMGTGVIQAKAAQ